MNHEEFDKVYDELKYIFDNTYGDSENYNLFELELSVGFQTRLLQDNSTNTTDSPTFTPSFAPTDAPVSTDVPTISPTILPTTVSSISPTISPTTQPTLNPTISPTYTPTISPTYTPTISPTINPTISPTINSTISPTLNPTIFPTNNPTISPTYSPTYGPTFFPTLTPTYTPTLSPSRAPTYGPTYSPTYEPTYLPTLRPTLSPNSALSYITFQQLLLNTTVTNLQAIDLNTVLESVINTILQNISIYNLQVKSYTPSSSRRTRHLRTYYYQNQRLLIGVGDVNIGYTAGYLSSTSSQGYTSIQNQLSSSIQSGVFNQQLQSYSIQNQITALMYVTSNSLLLSLPISNNSSSSKKNNESTILIIIICCCIGGCILLTGLLYYYRKSILWCMKRCYYHKKRSFNDTSSSSQTIHQEGNNNSTNNNNGPPPYNPSGVLMSARSTSTMSPRPTFSSGQTKDSEGGGSLFRSSITSVSSILSRRKVTSEDIGLLYMSKDSKETWKKVIVHASNGNLTYRDVETGTSENFSLEGYSVAMDQIYYICIWSETEMYYFMLRDEGSSWINYNGKIVHSNHYTLNSWLQIFVKHAKIANHAPRKKPSDRLFRRAESDVENQYIVTPRKRSSSSSQAAGARSSKRLTRNSTRYSNDRTDRLVGERYTRKSRSDNNRNRSKKNRRHKEPSRRKLQRHLEKDDSYRSRHTRNSHIIDEVDNEDDYDNNYDRDNEEENSSVIDDSPSDFTSEMSGKHSGIGHRKGPPPLLQPYESSSSHNNHIKKHEMNKIPSYHPELFLDETNEEDENDDEEDARERDIDEFDINETDQEKLISQRYNTTPKEIVIYPSSLTFEDVTTLGGGEMEGEGEDIEEGKRSSKGEESQHKTTTLVDARQRMFHNLKSSERTDTTTTTKRPISVIDLAQISSTNDLKKYSHNRDSIGTTTGDNVEDDIRLSSLLIHHDSIRQAHKKDDEEFNTIDHYSLRPRTTTLSRSHTNISSHDEDDYHTELSDHSRNTSLTILSHQSRPTLASPSRIKMKTTRDSNTGARPSTHIEKTRGSVSGTAGSATTADGGDTLLGDQRSSSIHSRYRSFSNNPLMIPSSVNHSHSSSVSNSHHHHAMFHISNQNRLLSPQAEYKEVEESSFDIPTMMSSSSSPPSTSHDPRKLQPRDTIMSTESDDSKATYRISNTIKSMLGFTKNPSRLSLNTTSENNDSDKRLSNNSSTKDTIPHMVNPLSNSPYHERHTFCPMAYNHSSSSINSSPTGGIQSSPPTRSSAQSSSASTYSGTPLVVQTRRMTVGGLPNPRVPDSNFSSPKSKPSSPASPPTYTSYSPKTSTEFGKNLPPFSPLPPHLTQDHPPSNSSNTRTTRSNTLFASLFPTASPQPSHPHSITTTTTNTTTAATTMNLSVPAHDTTTTTTTKPHIHPTTPSSSSQPVVILSEPNKTKSTTIETNKMIIVGQDNTRASIQTPTNTTKDVKEESRRSSLWNMFTSKKSESKSDTERGSMNTKTSHWLLGGTGNTITTAAPTPAVVVENKPPTTHIQPLNKKVTPPTVTKLDLKKTSTLNQSHSYHSAVEGSSYHNQGEDDNDDDDDNKSSHYSGSLATANSHQSSDDGRYGTPPDGQYNDDVSNTDYTDEDDDENNHNNHNDNDNDNSEHPSKTRGLSGHKSSISKSERSRHTRRSRRSTDRGKTKNSPRNMPSERTILHMLSARRSHQFNSSRDAYNVSPSTYVSPRNKDRPISGNNYKHGNTNSTSNSVKSKTDRSSRMSPIEDSLVSSNSTPRSSRKIDYSGNTSKSQNRETRGGSSTQSRRSPRSKKERSPRGKTSRDDDYEDDYEEYDADQDLMNSSEKRRNQAPNDDTLPSYNSTRNSARKQKYNKNTRSYKSRSQRLGSNSAREQNGGNNDRGVGVNNSRTNSLRLSTSNHSLAVSQQSKSSDGGGGGGVLYDSRDYNNNNNSTSNPRSTRENKMLLHNRQNRHDILSIIKNKRDDNED